MKIYVVGSSKNKFQKLDDIREKFIIDEHHEQANIDFLNPWYCELTGLYYLWRNCKDDIVGLEHYRRHFVNDKNELLSEAEITRLLATNDVICRKHVFEKNGNGFTWWRASYRANAVFNKFLNNLDELDRNFITYFLEHTSHFVQCNMFICRKEIIDEYCTWLFSELAKLSKNDFIRVPRIIGYIAEYVFGAWLLMYHYKIDYQTVKEYK